MGSTTCSLTAAADVYNPVDRLLFVVAPLLNLLHFYFHLFCGGFLVWAIFFFFWYFGVWTAIFVTLFIEVDDLIWKKISLWKCESCFVGGCKPFITYSTSLSIINVIQTLIRSTFPQHQSFLLTQNKFPL